MGTVTKEQFVIDYDTFAVVRCGYCGEIYSFCPRRVMYLGECKCGNDNWGRPPEWFGRQFGDFDLLWWERWDLRSLLPFGAMSVWGP